MALSLCTISGTIYYPDGSPAVGEVLRIVRAVKDGELLSSLLQTTAPADANGLITFSVPRNAIVWMWGNVLGFNTNHSTGSPLAIPDSATATLISVDYATTTPNTVPLAVPGGGYIHTQGSAATTWTITHNLGARPLAAQVYDTSYQLLQAQVVHTSTTVTTITFNVAQAGYARLI